jgi:hypothetical protein
MDCGGAAAEQYAGGGGQGFADGFFVSHISFSINFSRSIATAPASGEGLPSAGSLLAEINVIIKSGIDRMHRPHLRAGERAALPWLNRGDTASRKEQNK